MAGQSIDPNLWLSFSSSAAAPHPHRERRWYHDSDDEPEPEPIPLPPSLPHPRDDFADSYRVPRVAEVHTLRAVIQAEQGLIARLDENIAQADTRVQVAQKTVDDLKQQLEAAESALALALNSRDIFSADKEKYCTSVRQKQGALHPIRRTPLEILGYIFTLAVQESVIHSESKKGEVLVNPSQNSSWAISQVCRRWRNAAIGTPRMWRFIRVNFHRPLRSLFRPLNAVCTRVGAVPMDVHLQFADPQKLEEFSILWNSCPFTRHKKWRRLFIDFASVVQVHEHSTLPHPLPEVEEIHLVGRGTHMHLPHQLIPIVSGATRITSRNILLHHIDPRGPAHVPFKAKLLNLMLGNSQTLSTMDVSQVLLACPALEQLDLIASKGGVTPGANEPSFSHPALKQITFHAVHISSALRPLQRNISFPVLHFVHLLSLQVIPTTALVEGFTEFARRNPSIRRVQFSKLADAEKENADTTKLIGLRTILGSLSGLTNLVLVGDSSSAIVRALLYTYEEAMEQNSQTLLPNLETIILVRWSETSPIKDLVDLCAKRRGCVETEPGKETEVKREEPVPITVSIKESPPVVRELFRKYEQALF